MLGRKTRSLLVTAAVVLSSVVVPTMADASSKALTAKQQKVEKMHDYLMWYGSNKSAEAAKYDLSNKKDIVKSGAVYDKWLVSADFKNFQQAWNALSSSDKKVTSMKQVNKEHVSADAYLAATKEVFTYYNTIREDAAEIVTKGSNINEYLSKENGLRAEALKSYTNFRDVSGEAYKNGERRYYVNKKYTVTIDFLQGAQILDEARKALVAAKNTNDLTKISDSLSKVEEKMASIGTYSATFVEELSKEVDRVKNAIVEKEEEFSGLTPTQKLVMKEHQNLMLYGSNTPGKETYDLREVTQIVKKGNVYQKWVNSKDYENFHTSWSMLTSEEKKAPEMYRVYDEYQSAKTYLKATEAIFAYYDEAKNDANNIASKGERVTELLDSTSGYRQKALSTYKTYYTTSTEANEPGSRREYLNKKYLSVVSFLNGSKTLAAARDDVYNATKPETVDPIVTKAEPKVQTNITDIGKYSATYVSELQKALSNFKKSAQSRKKDFIYAVGKVNSNGEIVVSNSEYSTFDSASKSMGSNNVVVKRDKLKNLNRVIKADKGIVVVSTTTGTVYGNANLTNSRTYNAKGVELQYLDTVNEETVKVRIADTVGYMKMSESEIIQSDMVEGFSYYKNVGGVLYHYIYNQNSNYYLAGYPIGKEVGSLKENVKYYSLNGVDFYTANGSKVTSLNKKNLFQFMDMSDTSKASAYTAANIDNYLKAVKPGSPIIGEGKSFIEAGKKYSINPILLMSLANHESNYGTSAIATAKKNLFGINAIDSDPMGGATTYKTYKESILRAAEFLTTGYMNPNDWRYEGKYFGNKSEGFNVRYASDPFWGQKVAGHYYRFTEWVKANPKEADPITPEKSVEPVEPVEPEVSVEQVIPAEQEVQEKQEEIQEEKEVKEKQEETIESVEE